MELTGTAGRALGRRIGAVRDRNDRAASNDNRPVELARAEYPAREERLGCDGGSNTTALRQRGSPARDTGHPMADLK